MAITRLERKGRKNKSVAKTRVNTIKRLGTIPAIKNVDVEAIKAEFADKLGVETKKKKTSKKKEEEKEEVAVEAPVAEASEETATETPAPDTTEETKSEA